MINIGEDLLKVDKPVFYINYVDNPHIEFNSEPKVLGTDISIGKDKTNISVGYKGFKDLNFEFNTMELPKELKDKLLRIKDNKEKLTIKTTHILKLNNSLTYKQNMNLLRGYKIYPIVKAKTKRLQKKYNKRYGIKIEREIKNVIIDNINI